MLQHGEKCLGLCIQSCNGYITEGKTYNLEGINGNHVKIYGLDRRCMSGDLSGTTHYADQLFKLLDREGK
jgi:hypothetical protein